MNKYIDAEKLKAEIERLKDKYPSWMLTLAMEDLCNFINSIQQEQPPLPTIKGWIARDDAGRLGLYDQKPTRKTEPGAFSGIVHSWVIGDTWIGRFSLDQTAKPLFPNLYWTNDPIEVELTIKPTQEHPEVDLEKEIDEKWDEFVSSEGEREDFIRIARHFYEHGLNARKEE